MVFRAIIEILTSTHFYLCFTNNLSCLPYLSGVRAGGRSSDSEPREAAWPGSGAGRGERPGSDRRPGPPLPPTSADAKCLANSEPMKAASNSHGPNKWRMEEQRGRAGAGARFACSVTTVPVTALTTSAEAAAMVALQNTVSKSWILNYSALTQLEEDRPPRLMTIGSDSAGQKPSALLKWQTFNSNE